MAQGTEGMMAVTMLRAKPGCGDALSCSGYPFHLGPWDQALPQAVTGVSPTQGLAGTQQILDSLRLGRATAAHSTLRSPW